MQASISSIKCFKSCRKKYWFIYHEGLQPVQKPDALVTGTNYHAELEELYRNGGIVIVPTKEVAMALAYQKYIEPQFEMKSVEEWFNIPMGKGNIFCGRIDGMAENGWLVEHKTTSGYITEQYEYDLQWDEQLLAYMLATGARHCYYTVCMKPNIRQKKNETDDEFFERMCKWYDEDTETKIRLFEIERSDEEVEQFGKELLEMMAEMNTNHFYRNTSYCNMWGRRCEYSSICLNYDPNAEYVEFVKENRR